MSDTFRKRREAVLRALGGTGALVLPAAPEILIGRDTELRYVADPDLYYLTGSGEPEAVLVMTAQAFTMFVRARDEARELWTGRRGGVEAARELFGADAAHPVTEIGARLPELLASSDVLYARLPAARADIDAAVQHAIVSARTSRPRTGKGIHTVVDPGQILDSMRLVKDAEEIAAMREAARISAASFNDAMDRIGEGVGEWEIEAVLEYGFRSRGAQGPAFPTIVAAGANATVLHYTQNSTRLKNGDLLLIDAGARHNMYCADITRTMPVSGSFSSEQRDLYELVMAAHAAAIAQARPGNSVDAPHDAVVRVLTDGLRQLRILDKDDEIKRFYPHRTSHWLGLDVHDAGSYASRSGVLVFEPGMVLTIEPGLYLADSGIGIRVEDDVLITENGCEILTSAVPT